MAKLNNARQENETLVAAAQETGSSEPGQQADIPSGRLLCTVLYMQYSQCIESHCNSVQCVCNSVNLFCMLLYILI